ncbi:MAG: family 1 encapsulin nanocompartment shell protein [Sulfolobales archaeon]
MSREEIADAIRIAMAAEIDAINLYLQFARLIEDPDVRRVFEDIADEEKVHLGEFLAILKNIDPGQVEALKRGEEEIKSLTERKESSDKKNSLNKEDSSDIEEKLIDKIREKTRESRKNVMKLRRYLSVRKIPVGRDIAILESTSSEKNKVSLSGRRIIELTTLSYIFDLSKRSVYAWRDLGEEPDLTSAVIASQRLAYDEDKVVIERLLECKEANIVKISSWDTPGSAIEEISQAIRVLADKSVPEPYILILNPERYIKLLRVFEKTGVLELERVKNLVREIVVLPQLSADKAVILSTDPSVVELIVGADGELEFIGPEEESYRYRIFETLTLLIRNPSGIVILSQ